MESLPEVRQRIRDLHREMLNASNFEHYEALGEQLSNLRRMYRRRHQKERSSPRYSSVDQMKHHVSELKDRILGPGNQDYLEELEKQLVTIQREIRKKQQRQSRSKTHSIMYPHKYPKRQ